VVRHISDKEAKGVGGRVNVEVVKAAEVEIGVESRRVGELCGRGKRMGEGIGMYLKELFARPGLAGMGPGLGS
jgi:hypothetical protein